ncbi:2TM domain-containing protein [Flagellimonas myxillae]|uniref:2TM domain-containing protein n=1 Tax=Flagellimonas myxillae TaxID=2942214 RepID=UPI00201EB831|nr:2TM domain-containing protein [Muricauda myxillae]MCL6265507.1 2TM domain-containing protein [Muricauda myxillae]
MEITNDIKYQRAKEKVECLKSFYSNLLAYCLVIPFLAYINYMTTSFLWVVFPAIGWGIGLTLHWINATGNHPFLGKDWEERKIREYMNKNEY